MLKYLRNDKRNPELPACMNQISLDQKYHCDAHFTVEITARPSVLHLLRWTHRNQPFRSLRKVVAPFPRTLDELAVVIIVLDTSPLVTGVLPTNHMPRMFYPSRSGRCEQTGVNRQKFSHIQASHFKSLLANSMTARSTGLDE